MENVQVRDDAFSTTPARRRMNVRTAILVLIPLLYFIATVFDVVPYRLEIADATQIRFLPLFRIFLGAFLLFIYLVAYATRSGFGAVSVICILSLVLTTALDTAFVLPHLGGEMRFVALAIYTAKAVCLYILGANLADYRATKC